MAGFMELQQATYARLQNPILSRSASKTSLHLSPYDRAPYAESDA